MSRFADPPRYAYEREILADLAAHMLAQREAGDPVLVGKGKLSAADAEQRLRTMRAAAQERRAVLEGKPIPLDRYGYFLEFGAYPAEVQATLHAAASRTAQIAAAEPRNRDKADYAQATAALAFWADIRVRIT